MLTVSDVEAIALEILPMGWGFKRLPIGAWMLQMPNGRLATIGSLEGLDHEGILGVLRYRMDKLEQTGGM